MKRVNEKSGRIVTRTIEREGVSSDLDLGLYAINNNLDTR
jgi:hypothetical protein